MNTCEILQRPINQGPYVGMVETITNSNIKMPNLCYFCGRESESGAYWFIIGDYHGNAYCCRRMCDLCARELINGVPERAGKSPYKSLDPRKEGLRLQARKNRVREHRKEAVARLLFWPIIGFACLAGAAFIVCASYTITKLFIG